jgi:L-ascorbate metabolism protein UlaG (beta-lactamase superfamily)
MKHVFLILALAALHDNATAQTFTANNGLIHEMGTIRLAVDALFRNAFDEYPPLDEAMRMAFEEARPPFEGLDVILATHRHLDHMVPAAMASYLCHSPGTVAFIPVDARDDVLTAAPCDGLAEQIRSGFEPFVIDSLTITPVAVPHAGVDNRAYVLEYGGRRVVHLGDSSLSDELVSSPIDVLAAPYWNLGDDDFLKLYRRSGSPFLIAIHAPPADRAQVQARMDALGLAGWVPTAPMETRP